MGAHKYIVTWTAPNHKNAGRRVVIAYDANRAINQVKFDLINRIKRLQLTGWKATRLAPTRR